MSRMLAAVAFVLAVPVAAGAATCPLTVGDAVFTLRENREGRAPVPVASKIMDLVVVLGNEGDFDDDTLTNCIDLLAGADPRRADTDGDGLDDAEETFTTGTDPANADSDGDGFGDKDELDNGSNPRNVGIVPVDFDERFVFSAVGVLVSVQNDAPQPGVLSPFGVFGAAESTLASVLNHAPQPDTIAPFRLFGAAEGPLVSVLNAAIPPASPPPFQVFGGAESALVSIRNDATGGIQVDPFRFFGRFDGPLTSIQNDAVFGIALLSCTLDSDGDGLGNCMELLLGLRADAADSDGDGVPDGDEDSDGDGLSNLAEIAWGTYAMVADSDGDGFGDGDEVRVGSNPMDAESLPVDRSPVPGWAESAVTSVDNPPADPGS